jgi:hypothetical protein
LIAPEDDRSKRRHAHMECVRKARAAGQLPTRDEWLEAGRGPRPSRVARMLELLLGKKASK